MALTLFAGCTQAETHSAAPSGGEHPWTVPGELRIGLQTPPNSLNPLLAANTAEGMVDRLLFDGLVTVDPSGNQVPMLAATVPTLQNGGISKDGLTLTYHLRHDVKWHDGVPFTSKDVKFSWQAIMSSANNVISRTGYEAVKSVDTPDAFTVVFHMKRVFSPAINALFGESDDPFEVVPEHLLAKLPNINAIAFNSAPVGTGPFKFAEWARGDHITLVANDKYFLGAPKLRRIVIRFVPDENTEVTLLKTHDIDWQFEASPAIYRDVKKLPDIKIVLQERNEYEQVQFNLQHPLLADVRVRRAVAYAIDRQKLVDTLTYGSATAADQDLPPFMWAHSPNVTRYPYDPRKARELLREAGFTPGPDGVMQKNGTRLSLVFTTNSSNATRRLGLVQVQAMLHAVGIETSPKFYLGALLFAAMGQGGILQNGKYDLSWNGWVAGIDPDQSSVFLCSAQPPNGNNTMRYCNPAMDAAQHVALSNFDVTTRKAAYRKIEALLSADLPQVIIWWPRQVQPINPDFKNFMPNPVTASWNAYQWEI